MLRHPQILFKHKAISHETAKLQALMKKSKEKDAKDILAGDYAWN